VEKKDRLGLGLSMGVPEGRKLRQRSFTAKEAKRKHKQDRQKWLVMYKAMF